MSERQPVDVDRAGPREPGKFTERSCALLWMRYRGHAWRVVNEMMAGCALGAVVLVWLSVVHAGQICAIECGLIWLRCSARCSSAAKRG